MRTANRPSPLIALVAVAVLALGAGCAPSSGALGTPSTPAPTADASVAPPSGDLTPGPTASAALSPAPSGPAPTDSGPATASPGPTAAPSATVVVRAYFVLGSPTGNAGLAPVLREVPATQGVGAAAMRQLVAGPGPSELAASPAMHSSVPPASRLLGLSIAGGLATVDLSREFAAGLDTARPDARLAQVVYTLTQFPTVRRVAVQVEGAPLGDPAARDAFRDAFLPAIFVDRPAWGAAAGNPTPVSGVANVFEAAFRVQIRDVSGRVLADRQVMASCGTGCWGDFSAAIPYTVASAQWGTLRVFDLSPRDGSPENVTEYPVWLTPAG